MSTEYSERTAWPSHLFAGKTICSLATPPPWLCPKWPQGWKLFILFIYLCFCWFYFCFKHQKKTFIQLVNRWSGSKQYSCLQTDAPGNKLRTEHHPSHIALSPLPWATTRPRPKHSTLDLHPTVDLIPTLDLNPTPDPYPTVDLNHSLDLNPTLDLVPTLQN